MSSPSAIVERLARLRALARRRPALSVAAVVLVLATAALAVLPHRAAPLLGQRAAIRVALRDRTVSDAVSRSGWDRVDAAALDRTLERVSFFSHGRIVAEVGVRRDGTAVQGVDFTRAAVPYGNWLAYRPAMLIGFAILFCLMVCVLPIRRLRNLDALAALSLLAPVTLLQDRYLSASVLAALPGLGYLMARCGLVALGPVRVPAPSTPLYGRLTGGIDLTRRVRILRILLLATALTVMMVSVTSPDAVDVIYAVMEGATKLIHGILPYGHMPGDVMHGDTYPILSYALYAPLAWAAPVQSTWDSVDIALAATGLAVLACAAMLWRTLARAPEARGDPAELANQTELADQAKLAAEEAGLRAALAWLSFPTLLVTVSTGTTDVVLGAFLLLAVLLWRRPGASTGLLAVAGWFKFAPFVLVPIWLAPLRGVRLLRAVIAFGVVSLASLAVLVSVGGGHGPSAMIHALAYQFSRGSPQSVWAVLGLGSVQPLAQAAVLALIAGAVVRMRRDQELAGDRSRVAALAGSILIALQLSADYWAFLYVIWIAPLMVMSLMSADAPAEATARAARTEAVLPRLVAIPGR